MLKQLLYNLIYFYSVFTEKRQLESCIILVDTIVLFKWDNNKQMLTGPKSQTNVIVKANASIT